VKVARGKDPYDSATWSGSGLELLCGGLFAVSSEPFGRLVAAGRLRGRLVPAGWVVVVRPAMIQITKGNPTPEEIAAVVAVLALASATTQSVPIDSTATGWRGSEPLAQLNPAELSRRDRRWRPWSAKWSRVGPAHAPVPHRCQWTAGIARGRS
jgi:hypothetical protein